MNQQRLDLEDRITKLDKENRQLKHSISELNLLHDDSIREMEQQYRIRIENKNKEIAELMNELTEVQNNYSELEMMCASHAEERSSLSKSLEEKQQDYHTSLALKNNELTRLRSENQQLKYNLSDFEAFAKTRQETEVQGKFFNEKRREDLQKLELEIKELRRHITNLEDSKKVLELEKQSLEAVLASQERELLLKIEEKNKEITTLHRDLQEMCLEVESTKNQSNMELGSLHEKETRLLEELRENERLLQEYESLNSRLIHLEG